MTNVGLPGTVTVATAITVAGESITGHSFEVLTTSENTCLAAIAAGQSCTLLVEFAPTMSGDHADLLTLTPSAGGHYGLAGRHYWLAVNVPGAGTQQ